MAGGKTKDDGKYEHSAKVELAGQAVLSTLFRSYALMLSNRSEVFDALARWGEGCACHPELPELNGLGRRQRGQELLNIISELFCPLRALQAPSFAAGRCFELMNDVLEMANANLLMNADVMGCSTSDRNTLLADFAKARRHIRFILTTRLAWCRYLPWILAGTGTTY